MRSYGGYGGVFEKHHERGKNRHPHRSKRADFPRVIVNLIGFFLLSAEMGGKKCDIVVGPDEVHLFAIQEEPTLRIAD